ncbi:glycine/D-amino acid oxidase-like deaminating enzyme [Peteryoungia aggregata LMG 23059]|uniref:Glycine/D-amino acid oxidase-like deaminating enzyme n=1 Tax=Peteryoungia aggregata LMG 23059 TaxID=1368425 RepID=A0ABU0GAQ4_9HYPH|nr:FAD-binding oxidoreductase [Peteryoungia aggregata]MDQ0422434.1 glycine/D-amino acid oxidase-like deaminating enzyme [Peteryoungia aggregata LMG 23059]
MRAPLLTIETADDTPPEADVVVIGAGIVGTCTAYYLARRGVKVVLVEKGRPGAEQSSRNWGWCRQQNRDARELPMATRSLALWDAMAEEIGPELGFRRSGLLYLSNNEAELEGWARWRDFARTQNVETHMLTAEQATGRAKATGKRWKGGVFSPTDGIADPSRAVPLIARAIETHGGRVLQNCAVRGLELAGGKVCGVVTERGTIRTPTAIMAGGAWASSFCRQLGIRFPQASVRASILSVSHAEGLPDALHTAQVSLTARHGGHTLAISGKARVDPTGQMLRFGSTFIPMFLKRHRSLAVGGLEGIRSGHETLSRWSLDRETPMERMRILDPKPDQSQINETLKRARDLIPALQASQVTAAWAGYIDSTPDGVPAIGETDIPGFVLAAGFSGHGFGIGTGAGEMIADLVMGKIPALDASSYHPSRFHESSWGKVADF